jgi:hypothetical protein
MSRCRLLHRRRGITVLGLVLLIIALMVGGFFVVRYLQDRPAATQSPPVLRPTMFVSTS